jgi:hypothetical protein
VWEHDLELKFKHEDGAVLRGRSKKEDDSIDNVIWEVTTDLDFNILSLKSERSDEEFLASLKKRIKSLRLSDLFE